MLHFSRIDLIRVRILTNLTQVRLELQNRERARGPHSASIWFSPETKWWSHDENAGRYRARIVEDGRQIVEPQLTRCGPRGEPIIEASSWRDFLAAAEANPGLFGRFGLDAFVAAHGDNALHPFQPIAWSAYEWSAYNHAIARTLPKLNTGAA